MADGPDGGICGKKERVRDDSGRLGLSNQNGSAFPCDGDDHVEQSVRGLAVI